jgi:hypothetical protein
VIYGLLVNDSAKESMRADELMHFPFFKEDLWRVLKYLPIII